MPAAASFALDSPLALAWRLQRSTLIAWIISALFLGVAIGSVAQSMSVMVGVQLTGWMLSMGVRDQGHALLYIVIYAFCQCLLLYALLSALSLRSEESSMRADLLLSTPISRLRWAMSHLLFAFVGPLVILLVFGLTTGIVYGVSVGNLAGEAPQILLRTMMALPALWLLLAIVVVVYGYLPKMVAAIGWALLAGVLLLEVAHESHLVDRAIFALSPFAHVHWSSPQIPVVAMTLLTVEALLLTGIGLSHFQHRDII